LLALAQNKFTANIAIGYSQNTEKLPAILFDNSISQAYKTIEFL